MRRILGGAVLLAAAAGLTWTHAGTIGIEHAWPIAVGFALAAAAPGRRSLAAMAFGTVAGIAAAWSSLLVVTLALPFIPASLGAVVAVAVAAMVIAAHAAPATLSPAAMLAGFGCFYGVYEATWTADRTGFLGDSAAAAAALAMTLLGGMVVAHVALRLGAGGSTSNVVELPARREDDAEEDAGISRRRRMR